MQFPLAGLRGGDGVSLSNGSRTLTTLHVAHLKVAVTEQQTALSGGTCEPGEYYGSPLADAPTNASAGGPGVALTGEVCPLNGHAAGLSTAAIAQTDEFSGGLTKTEVPSVQDTSPIQGETVYGPFTALAESGLPGPNGSVTPARGSAIAVRIAHARSGRVVFRAANVETQGGVLIKGLPAGAYTAAWTLTDASGDTRTVTTRFIEQVGTARHSRRRGSRGSRLKLTCGLGRRGAKCVVTFPARLGVRGTLRMTVTAGGTLAALGHARVRLGRATVVLHHLRPLKHGSWKVTVVLSQPHQAAMTSTVGVRV